MKKKSMNYFSCLSENSSISQFRHKLPIKKKHLKPLHYFSLNNSGNITKENLNIYSHSRNKTKLPVTSLKTSNDLPTLNNSNEKSHSKLRNTFLETYQNYEKEIFPHLPQKKLTIDSKNNKKTNQILNYNPIKVEKKNNYIKLNPSAENIYSNKENFDKLKHHIFEEESIIKIPQFKSIFLANNKLLVNNINKKILNPVIESKIKYKIIENPLIKFDSNDDKFRLKNLFKNFGDVTYCSYIKK